MKPNIIRKGYKFPLNFYPLKCCSSTWHRWKQMHHSRNTRSDVCLDMDTTFFHWIHYLSTSVAQIMKHIDMLMAFPFHVNIWVIIVRFQIILDSGLVKYVFHHTKYTFGAESTLHESNTPCPALSCFVALVVSNDFIIFLRVSSLANIVAALANMG